MDEQLKSEIRRFLWSLIHRDIFKPGGTTMYTIHRLLERL